MTKHRIAKLNEICANITDGKHGDCQDQENSGYFFISCKDVANGKINYENARQITESDFQDTHRRTKLEPLDILITNSGTIGRMAIIQESELARRTTFQKSVAILKPIPSIVNAHFLYYSLQADLQRLIENAGGTAQKNLLLRDLRAFIVVLPDLPDQQRIAGILSAYDDLIENNRRRIKILEEMARSLYREWFVHFRYPGNENIPLVDSPLGPIPKEWEVVTLREVTTKIGSGATPRGGKESYKDDGITLIRSMNIYDYSFEFTDLAFIDGQQAADLDNVAVQENDVLLNITGASVARCCLVPSHLLPARVNQHVAIIRAKRDEVSPFFILDTINSEDHKAHLLALAQGGATREALTKDTISNYQIVLPSPPMNVSYGNIAFSIHKQREVLQKEIQNLKLTRDLLLPRLLPESPC